MTPKDIFFLIWLAVMVLNIIINLCVFIALRKSNNKTIAQGLEKGSEVVGKVFTNLNLEGVKTAVDLLKEICLPSQTASPTTEASDNEDKK